MQKKYEVLGIVGEGAYGVVYKCKNKITNEFVAIKKFKETDDEIVIKTMKRELEMLKKIKHENIVEYKESFIHKKNLYLVFEYVEKNLLELLQETPNGISPPKIKYLIYQLIKAIKYLHSKNIIHRDIKPENLLINPDLKLKLCDFGFAREVKLNMENNNISQMTDYVATRWYRAPELLLSEGIYGPEVDYWAIGCIMGELIDGNPIFPGDDEYDQLNYIIKIIGNLPIQFTEMFYENPIFQGKDLLFVDKIESLDKRYLGKISKDAIDFMKQLLRIDPSKRLNGDTVFKHKYYEDYLDNHTSNTTIIHKIELEIKNRNNIFYKEKENFNFSFNGYLKEKINNKTNIKIKEKKINLSNLNKIKFNKYEEEKGINTFKEEKNISPQSERFDLKLGNTYSNTRNYDFPNITLKNYSPEKNNLNKTTKLNNNKKIIIKDKKYKISDTVNNNIMKSNIDLSNIYNKNPNKNEFVLTNSQLAGYQTYINQKNDKYNFKIDTDFKDKNYLTNYKKIKQKDLFTEENEKNKSKDNPTHKISMFYLGNFGNNNNKKINKNNIKDKKLKTEIDSFNVEKKFSYVSHNGKTKVIIKFPKIFQLYGNFPGDYQVKNNNNNFQIQKINKYYY
jgi:cyclin-dependent kinase-like